MLTAHGGRVFLATLAVVPLLLVLTLVPVAAEGHTITVTSHETGAVVEGQVTFQGTAEDPGSDLREVRVAIEGFTTLKKNVPGNQRSYYNWSLNWNTQAVPDGSRNATATAVSGSGASTPVVLALIVDNDKEPKVQTLTVWFDSEANGTYVTWNDLEAVPTTRLSFDLRFSEPINEASLGESVAFDGGTSTWAVVPQGGAAYWVNVSYLAANTSYTFLVGTKAMDLAGNPVTPYEVAFRTAAEPTPGTPEGPGETDDPSDPSEPGGGLNLGVYFYSPWTWIGVGVAAAAIATTVAWRKGRLAPVKERLGRLKERLADRKKEVGESEWESGEDDQ